MDETCLDPARRLADSLISIVLPVYNEAAVLRRLVALAEGAIESCTQQYEILFVNDGSTDGSAELLNELSCDNPHIRVLHFSRNFGHQAAIQAGLRHARGDVVILMDSDLQDDPAAIPAFLRKWQEGFDVVYAVRACRKENPIKKAFFFSFYRVLNLISRTPIPNDAGIFGLVDRKVATCIADLIERDRYFPGLRHWVGFRQTGIVVERGARYDDSPRVSLLQLFRLAKSAVFSFSAAPLSMFYGIALLSMFVCLGLTGFTLYHKLLTGLATPGWASALMTGSFFGALNALGIAILGEYVIRIYDQVRSRPLYIVQEKVNFGNRAADKPLAPSQRWQVQADGNISEPELYATFDKTAR